MVERRDEKGRGNPDIYKFDPGQSFFHDERLEGPNDGIDGEIPVIDPSQFGSAASSTENGDAGIASSDGTSDTSAAGRKTRRDKGQPRGPRSSASQKAIYLGGWEDFLFAGHLLAAKLAHCPELEIDEAEARKLTIALDKLAVHYNVQPTETQKLWANVIGVAGSIYGPKMVAIYARQKKERETRLQRVVPIRPE